MSRTNQEWRKEGLGKEFKAEKDKKKKKNKKTKRTRIFVRQVPKWGGTMAELNCGENLIDGRERANTGTTREKSQWKAIGRVQVGNLLWKEWHNTGQTGGKEHHSVTRYARADAKRNLFIIPVCGRGLQD